MARKSRLSNACREQISSTRTIHIGDFILKGEVYKLREALLLLNSENKEYIGIVFNDCVGGDLGCGLMMYKDLIFSKAPIIGFVEKQASSTASIVLQGCHKKLASSEAEFFLHYPYKGKDCELSAAEILAQQDEALRIYSWAMKKPVAEVKQLLDQKKTLSAKEAIKWKLVHEIHDPK